MEKACVKETYRAALSNILSPSEFVAECVRNMSCLPISAQ